MLSTTKVFVLSLPKHLVIQPSVTQYQIS